MPTNLALPDDLIDEAAELGCHMTKREAATAALEEYVGRRSQLGILQLVGQVEYEEGYDYKESRRRDMHETRPERNPRDAELKRAPFTHVIV